MVATNLELALKRHADISGKRLQKRHPDAVQFLHNAGITPGKIREHATKLLTSGTLVTSLLLASPALKHPPAQSVKLAALTLVDRENQFSQELLASLPHGQWKLTESEENTVANIIKKYWGISARAELEGNRLNNSYGLIGAEQHLPRFPGDTVSGHDEYQESGITPGRGAWGYFVSSKQDLNYDVIQKEKYYVAVQTLYLPEWNTRNKELKEWYQFRKVIVVNPTNGKTIVCDIADAGPAQFTGKHFGGSPEVMNYLDLNKGMKKGAVLLFFIDDKNNTVPLGPVEYNVETGRPTLNT